MKPLRRINSLSMSETRWVAYATASVASAFGLSSSAEAEIHYSGNVFIKLTGNAHASIPLSNGASLYFKNSHGTDTFLQWFTFQMKGAISGSARGINYHYGRIFLSNLPSGVNVSAGRFYSIAGHHSRHGVLFSNWSDGQFANPASGFVGFRFNTGKGTQYGWARIKTRDINNHTHDVIKDYAWGDVGDVIRTGQKSSSGEMVDTVTDSGSVGLLALGAAGLIAWRKQREQATQ